MAKVDFTVQRLALSSGEIIVLTGWADPMVNDYLSIQEIIINLVEAVGTPAIQTDVPATASSPGEAGQVALDSNYFYVCTATDTWKRALLSSW